MTLAIFPIVSSYSQTYVALATLLPPELRPRASCAGLCYIELARQVSSDLYRARVVALPHYLNGSYPRKVYPVYLSDEEVAQALPYERDLQHLSTCDLREAVEQHVRQTGGSRSVREEAHLVSGATPDKLAEKPLVEGVVKVYVSSQTVEDAAAMIAEPGREGARKLGRRTMLQLIWLKAALLMMRRQLASAGKGCREQWYRVYRNVYRSLEHLMQFCQRTSKVIACAGPVSLGNRQVGWHVHVRIPAQRAA